MKHIMKKLLSLTFLCGLLTAPALHGAAASSNENTMNENTAPITEPEHFEPIKGNITLIGRDGTVDLAADAAQRFSGFIRHAITFNKASGKDFRNITLRDYDRNLLQLIAKLITLRSENASLKQLAHALKESSVDFNQILQLADYLNLDKTVIQAIGLAYAPAIVEEYQNQIASVAPSAKLPEIFSSKNYKPVPEHLKAIIIPFITDAYMAIINNDINKLPDDLKGFMATKTNDAAIIDGAFLNRINTPQHTLAGHSDMVRSLAFNSDGSQLASGSLDNTVKIWDPRNLTAQPVTLTDHTNIVTSLTFSRDGSQLASGSLDNAILVWDPRNLTAQPVTLTGHTNIITSLAFSRDDSQLASGASNGTIKIWNPRNLTEQPVTLTDRIGQNFSLTFNSDGSRLASGSEDGNITIWNLRNRNEQPVALTDHTSRVSSVAFSPDCSQLASGSNDNTVKIWNPRNWTEQPITLTHTASVTSLDFSPDGSQLASGSADGSIRIWNPRDWTAPPVTLTGTDRIVSVAFNPDCSQLASSGSVDGTTKIWAMPNSIKLPYQQFDLAKRAAVAWARNEPFVINNTEDLETYTELPEIYHDERLFTLPVQAASSSEPVAQAASSSVAAVASN